MPQPMMKGRLYRDEFWPWGFQDERFIFKDESRAGGEFWSHRGRHTIELGDHLKIFDKSGAVIFDRELTYGGCSYSGNTWFPDGISRQDWVNFFTVDNSSAYSAELTPLAPKSLWLAIRGVTRCPLIRIIDYREVSGEPILNSGIGYLASILWNFPGEKPAVPLSLSFTPREFWCNKKAHGKRYCICKIIYRSHLLAMVTVPGVNLEKKIICPPRTPVRLKEAVDRFFFDRPRIESFTRNSEHGFYSFEAVISYSLKRGGNIRIQLGLRNRAEICGCSGLKDKIGRWSRKTKKEERICVCKDLPQDVPVSIKPL